MSKINYPLKFKPILKEKIWGGTKLLSMLHKRLDEGEEFDTVGESWELSDVEEDKSYVINGEYKGYSIQDLIIIHRGDLMGEKVFKNFSYQFPLLIKFIDAKEALSIQLHPDDELAKKRHRSFGKTEMWYVMQADKGSNLIVGFNQKTDLSNYLEHLKEKKILDILNVDEVEKGDTYFIPPGRIHAIGAGVLLAEIQQTSDVTYRVYDWDRKDDEGNARELHTFDAIEALNFSIKKAKVDYKHKENKAVSLVDCQYFTTNFIAITDVVDINNADKDSFVIYMCVSGNIEIQYGNDAVEILNMGETILIPAVMKTYSLVAKDSAELLEVYIK